MTQTPHSSPGGPPDDAGHAGEADALERMREQLMSISAGDVVAEAAMPLLTLAYARLGLPPEEHARYRDLPAARLLIDALGGMLDGVQGRLGRVEGELRDALARVRMAYVDVTRHTAGDHAPGAPPPEAHPARQEAEEGGPGGTAGEGGGTAPGEPRPEGTTPDPGEGLTRPSGLWVPGQPL